MCNYVPQSSPAVLLINFFQYLYSILPLNCPAPVGTVLYSYYHTNPHLGIEDPTPIAVPVLIPVEGSDAASRIDRSLNNMAFEICWLLLSLALILVASEPSPGQRLQACINEGFKLQPASWEEGMEEHSRYVSLAPTIIHLLCSHAIETGSSLA